MASVTPKQTSEIARAAQRIRPSLLPSLFGSSSNRIAPASGSAHESVSRGTTGPVLPARIAATPLSRPANWHSAARCESYSSSSYGPPTSSPQVVAEDHDDPDKDRAGVSADRPGLQPAQRRRPGLDDAAGAVDEAVDYVDVEPAPQPVARNHL